MRMFKRRRSRRALNRSRGGIVGDGTESLQSCSEEELARRAKGGSAAAFEELARRLQGPLIGFLQRRFASREDAEDVAQEAFLRTYQAMGKFRQGKRFRTWLFTIAYRLAVSRRRSARKMEEVGEVMDQRDGPREQLGQREWGERVWATAREVLGEEQVLALWLYYVEAMPAAEVGRVMGKSWVSVKTMLHRARKKLEPHLAEMEGETVRIGGLR